MTSNMVDSGNKSQRAYNSPLREDRAKQTRDAIVDALVEQVAEAGLSDFSVPKVAKRAGVSTRTVYRYFPTREDLLAAVGQFWSASIEIDPVREVDDLPRSAIQSFSGFDTVADQIIAAMSTQLGRASNHAAHSKRTEEVSAMVEAIAGNLSDDDRRNAVAVIRSLHSSRVWKSMRDDFDMSGDESGHAVAWALRVLIDDIRRRNQAAASDGGDDG